MYAPYAQLKFDYMKQYVALRPDIDDPLLELFARYIRNQSDIRMPASVQKLPPYPDDLQVLEVPRRPHPNALVKLCWFNCRDYVENNPGSEVVFGWQIERLHHNNERFALGALHHAIIRQNSELIDITPFEVANDQGTLVFLPDSRVPYDYEKRRTPMPLFWSLIPMLRPFWTSELDCPNEHQLGGYGVGRSA